MITSLTKGWVGLAVSAADIPRLIHSTVALQKTSAHELLAWPQKKV